MSQKLDIKFENFKMIADLKIQLQSMKKSLEGLPKQFRSIGRFLMVADTSDDDIEFLVKHIMENPIKDKNGGLCLDLHYKNCQEAGSLIRGYLFASYCFLEWRINREEYPISMKIFTGKGHGSAKIPVLPSKLKDVLAKYKIDYDEYKPGQYKVKV